MIISGLVYYLRPVTQTGAILLYVGLHKGPEPLGKEIAEYVFCELAISDIKRRTDTTGLGEEDMLCIMSGPDEDADGSGVM
ncbi:hypothetical protein BHE74_00034189 [Ensete ventricosum]|nr:hypothetical protein BHE74_00034189 [Ensete ventricosum]RZS28450.1 hypothetical protein BHM03_00062046 [Ensete ventricosum]